MGVCMVSGWVDARIHHGDCGCEFTGVFHDHKPSVRSVFNDCNKCFEPRLKSVYKGIRSGKGGYKFIEITCECECMFQSYCGRITKWTKQQNTMTETCISSLFTVMYP